MAFVSACRRAPAKPSFAGAAPAGANDSRRRGSMSNSGPQGRGRLTRSAEFDAVYRRGRSAASRHLVAYAFPTELQETRLGIAVSRKVGGAVVRNKLKRQLREAFAAMVVQPAAMDIVLVARPGLDTAVETQGYSWLVDEVTGLIERSVGSVAA